MVENDLSKNNSLLISNKQQQQQQMMKNNEIESFLSFDGIENSGITSQSKGNDLLLDINESSNTVIKEHNSNSNRKHSKNFRRKSQPHGSPVSCSEDDENDDLYSFTPPSCSNTPNTMFSLTKTNSAIESISGTTVVSSPSFFDQPIKEETEPFSLLDIPLDTGLSGKDITVDFSTDNFDFKDFTMGNTVATTTSLSSSNITDPATDTNLIDDIINAEAIVNAALTATTTNTTTDTSNTNNLVSTIDGMIDAEDYFTFGDVEAVKKEFEKFIDGGFSSSSSSSNTLTNTQSESKVSNDISDIVDINIILDNDSLMM
ncbi:unnamed protein product [[Candida] boidinii]|nr:unnamed protein product [[Candida] boidinii]